MVYLARKHSAAGAKEKARTYRKDIVDLGTLDETSASRLFDGANSLSCKTSKQTPTKIVVGLAAGGGLPVKEETFLFPADNTVAIFAKIRRILTRRKSQLFNRVLILIFLAERPETS